MTVQVATAVDFDAPPQRRRADRAQPQLVTADQIAAHTAEEQPRLDVSSEETHGKGDPGLAPVDGLRKRMRNLLEGTGENTLIGFTKVRDEADAVMRVLRAEIERLDKEFDRFAFLCQRGIVAEGLISKTLQDLKDELGTTRLQPTVTHQA